MRPVPFSFILSPCCSPLLFVCSGRFDVCVQELLVTTGNLSQAKKSVEARKGGGKTETSTSTAARTPHDVVVKLNPST